MGSFLLLCEVGRMFQKYYFINEEIVVNVKNKLMTGSHMFLALGIINILLNSLSS